MNSRYVCRSRTCLDDRWRVVTVTGNSRESGLCWSMLQRLGASRGEAQLSLARRTDKMFYRLFVLAIVVGVLAPPPPPRIRSQLHAVLERVREGIDELTARRPVQEFIAHVPADFRLVGPTTSCPRYMIPATLRAQLFQPFHEAPFGVRSLLRRGSHCFLWYLPGECLSTKCFSVFCCSFLIL